MDSIWQYGECMMSSIKKKPKWEYQGKTKKQVEFSEMMAGGSMLLMIILILVSWIWKLLT